MNKQLWTRLATEHNLAAPERPAVKEPEKSESEEHVPKLKLPAILWQWTDYRIVAHDVVMPDIQTRYQHIVKYTAEKANGSDSLGVTRWVEAGPEDFRDFVTVLGRYMYATQIKMFHEQDCCEDARIGDGEK